MKACNLSLLLIPFTSVVGVNHNARNSSILTPFAFVPPAPEMPPPLPVKAKPNKRSAPAPDEEEASRVNIEEIVNEAQNEIQAELGNKLVAEQPEKEMEEKARSKGNFLTKIMEEASKIFSIVNIWYKWEKRYNRGGGSQSSESDNRETKSAQGDSDSIAFQNQVLHDLQKGTPSTPLTMSDIHKIEKAYPQPLPPDCVRDYSVQCPENFVQEGTSCSAAPGYTGPCSKLQPELHLLGNAEKASWARACKAKYPCMPDHCPAGTDYSQPCPIGWSTTRDGKCAAEDSSSDCDGKITAAADLTAKVHWESACGVRWPCKKTICVKDFSANCPSKWSEVGRALCAAPPTYGGPCSQRLDLSSYKGNSDLKRAFELRCNVSWDCKNSTREKERDFSVACPLGWAVIDGNSCRAPPSYAATETCPKIISFAGRSPEDRQAYATLCGLDFPFLERGSCDIDFSFVCPLAWMDTGNGQWCQAPEGYTGNCVGESRVITPVRKCRTSS